MLRLLSLLACSLALEPVDLGTAEYFVMLAKNGISTTSNPVVTGNIGVSNVDVAAITGFSLSLDQTGQFSTSTKISGNAYGADHLSPTDLLLLTAKNDMQQAYLNAYQRSTTVFPVDVTMPVTYTLQAGVHTWTAALGFAAGDRLTLNGDVDDVFILQLGGALTVGAGAKIFLTGGVKSSNVFWQVNGAVTLGAHAHMEGIFLVQGAMGFGDGATLNGRIFADGLIALTSNPVVTEPEADPTSMPTASPTFKPTAAPTSAPTFNPTRSPTATPTHKPTATPTATPTAEPTRKPTAGPSPEPTRKPTVGPSAEPTRKPTVGPSAEPTRKPTAGPSAEPTRKPTAGPSVTPTRNPTAEPTRKPTTGPSAEPTRTPTATPTLQPTRSPTSTPTRRPTGSPTQRPTQNPTDQPVAAATPESGDKKKVNLAGGNSIILIAMVCVAIICFIVGAFCVNSYCIWHAETNYFDEDKKKKLKNLFREEQKEDIEEDRKIKEEEEQQRQEKQLRLEQDKEKKEQLLLKEDDESDNKKKEAEHQPVTQQLQNMLPSAMKQLQQQLVQKQLRAQQLELQNSSGNKMVASWL